MQKSLCGEEDISSDSEGETDGSKRTKLKKAAKQKATPPPPQGKFTFIKGVCCFLLFVCLRIVYNTGYTPIFGAVRVGRHRQR